MTGLTDQRIGELKTLANLPKLYFSLSQGRLSDAGLKELMAFPNLTGIDVGGMPVTDAGLRELAGLKNLTELHLGSTQVTDAGFECSVTFRTSSSWSYEIYRSRTTACMKSASCRDSRSCASSVPRSPILESPSSRRETVGDAVAAPRPSPIMHSKIW